MSNNININDYDYDEYDQYLEMETASQEELRRQEMAEEYERQMEEYERQAEEGEYINNIEPETPPPPPPCGHSEYDDECSPETCGRGMTNSAFRARIADVTALNLAREQWNLRGSHAGPFCDQCDEMRTGVGGRICLSCDVECGCGCEGDQEDHDWWLEIRRGLAAAYTHYRVDPPA